MSRDTVLLWLQPPDGMQDPGHPRTYLWWDRPHPGRHRPRRRGLHHPQGRLQCLLHPGIGHATLRDLVRLIHASCLALAMHGTAQNFDFVPLCTHIETYRKMYTLHCPRFWTSSHGDLVARLLPRYTKATPISTSLCVTLELANYNLMMLFNFMITGRGGPLPFWPTWCWRL